MRKSLFAGILALSVLLNLFLLYSVADSAEALSDHASQIELRDRQIGAMQAILPSLLKGKTSRDLLSAAQKSRLEVLEKDQNEVWIETWNFDRMVATSPQSISTEC